MQIVDGRHELGYQQLPKVSGLFCIRSLPKFFFDCLLLFFLWVVSTCVLISLVLLIDGFVPLLIPSNIGL